ncbi:hypothetical protein N657DRAFT_583008 [Parathielavia appendiculata]|uniref:Uncharacterized protein n=1 Tax=Parathielavia appendiculata TaxID=2587402 RepID=A0AAN6TQF1_9PEZI|nr:hypothetical protein N657DRAFT_583008 [Parathielavia appendiculata]
MEPEIKQATRLLEAQRAVDRDGQPLSWVRNRLSSQAGTVYTAREVNKVLTEVVESDGSVGVVKALLALGADVNFARRRHSNTWNKITQRNYPGERSNILLRAVIRCRPETVYAIAGHADQANLDSVLHHAIARGNLAVLAALLEHGASPVHLHDDFQEVVFHDNLDLLKVLLSGHHLPCLACRSTGLRIAVENRSLEAVRLLLDHWADVNYGDAIALTRAVEISRPDLVALLISGPVQPSSRSLDAAVGKLRQYLGENDTTLNREMLELCLSAGASGPETMRMVTEGLVELVRRRHTHLIGIILRHKKPPGQYEAAALIEAVRAEQLEVVAKLLEFSPSPSSLAVGVSQAVGAGSPQFRYEATRLLIASGAQGPCAAEALVKTVHCLVANLRRGDKMSIERDMRLFYLLLHEGKADVNFDRGEALQIAVRSAAVEVAEEILAKEPSPDSLGAALTWAMNVRDEKKKRLLVEMLVRRQINEDAAGKALVALLKTEPVNANIVELLLTRASVNYNNGEVFIYAIRHFRLEIFHLLLGQGISHKSLFTAILEALNAPTSERKLVFSDLLSRMQPDHLNTALKHVVLEEETDLAMVRMLLDSGADAGHEDGFCIKHAASVLNRDLLRLLSEHLGPHGSIYSQALASIVSRGKQWIAFEHVEAVNLLFQHGASGPIAGRALVEVVDHLACQQSRAGLAETLLRSLFAANVDVNHENGKVICIAASRGDSWILSLLLAHGATSSSATLALTAAIMAHHSESTLLQLIETFADKRHATPDFDRSIPGLPPPIFQCLKSYGKSTAVLSGLVKAGCRLETTIPMNVFSPTMKDREERVVSSELEPASVLMWALLQEEGVVSSAVMEALVRHGADVSYASPKSRTTPLLMAVKSGRVDVARMLIEAGARVSAKDVSGHSALFYASRDGNSELVKLLLESKPVVNDGSLHEACRGFHVQAMKLLLQAGHDCNYRSIKHGGRTALGEIALRAAPPTDIAAAEEALDLLVSVDASPLLKVHGKTIIFLALDNEHNESITRLLLDRMLYRTLNSHENTYQQGVLHYSPTMYVAKGILLRAPSETLIQLLRAHGCEDRFYATIEEAQPPDAVGLPEEIRDYERDRRARQRQNRLMEEEHANKIRREREKAIAIAQLEDDKHYRMIQHREDDSQQQRRHRGLDHHQTIQMSAEKHHNDAQIKLSAANVYSQVRWQKHTDDLAMISQKRDADLSHRNQAYHQHLDQRRDKLALETEARELRQARSLAHMREVQQQRWQERSEKHAQQLTYENQRMIQEYEMLWKKQQVKREGREVKLAGSRETHEMKMTELRTQRGNIIGQVNLEELRRWQESERRMKMGLGQGQGKVVQGRLLT